MLKIFLFILVMFAVACAILSLLFLPEICEWADDKREEIKERQYIDFKSFQHFYTVSEDRWELEKDYVKFIKEYEQELYRIHLGCEHQYITFHFHLKDRRQYKKWKRTYEKQEQQIASIESMQEVLSIIKKDIDKFNKENEARIDEATDNIDTIISRMSKL